MSVLFLCSCTFYNAKKFVGYSRVALRISKAQINSVKFSSGIPNGLGDMIPQVTGDGSFVMQVCTGPMNGFGNYTYDVWLWDDQTHKFMPLTGISGIFDPYVDTDNKCIVSTWRLDDEVEIVRYKWQDGKLVESDHEQMSYSDLTDD